MNQVFKSLGLCALFLAGGAASAQDFGPRGPGDGVGREERRIDRRGGDDDGDRGGRGGRGQRADRGGDDNDRGRDGRGGRDRFDRGDRGDRFGRRDGPDTRIVVRPGVNYRPGVVYRPGFVVTQPAPRLVCTVVQERRFNPGTGVVRIRPVRECARFAGRRRIVVTRQILG